MQITSCFIAIIITACSAIIMIFFIISSLYYVDSKVLTQVRILLHVCINLLFIINMQNKICSNT